MSNKENSALTLQQRRAICESCKNHSNEIETNPDSPAICGLTKKISEFTGEKCALYVPIPNFKSFLLRRGIYALVVGIALGSFGGIRIVNHLITIANGPDDFSIFSALMDIMALLVGVSLLIYSVKTFVKVVHFKYPDE